jgi:uncharacterized membrane protein HdeD (DUF308 family)
MADPTGFEPAISSVTGWHVGPLHHGSSAGGGSYQATPVVATRATWAIVGRLYSGPRTGSGMKPSLDLRGEGVDMTVVGVPDAAELQGRWKWFFAIGLAFTVLGIIALGNLIATTLITTIIVGLLLLAAGVFQVFGVFATGGTTGSRVLGLLLGILYVLVGFDILANPIGGAVTITLVVSIFLIAGGLVRLISSLTGAGRGHRFLLFLTGVVNILLGVWLWTGIPVSGLAIGLFVGVDLVMAGVTWMVLAWGVRGSAKAVGAAA